MQTHIIRTKQMPKKIKQVMYAVWEYYLNQLERAEKHDLDGKPVLLDSFTFVYVRE